MRKPNKKKPAAKRRHRANVTHRTTASSPQARKRGGHPLGVTPLETAASPGALGLGQLVDVTLGLDADREPLFHLVALMRQRNQLQQAELRLNNQVKAIRRVMGQVSNANQSDDVHDSAEFIAPDFVALKLTAALAGLRKDRRAFDRQAERLVKALPIWPWAEKIRGCGPLILAQIIAGSATQKDKWQLPDYPNPAKLWKRWGLAPGQRRVKGRTKAKIAEAIAHGFSVKRRAIAHVLGECLVKGRTNAYYPVYIERKAYELTKLPLTSKGKPQKLWAHKRALKFIEKRFLLDMWRQWRGQESSGSHTEDAPPAAT